MKNYLDIFSDDSDYSLLCGDSLKILKEMPSNSIDCIITSPPYWGQRIYEDSNGEIIDGLGNEANFEDYISSLMEILNQCKRILKNDGSLWLNIGDKYLNKSLAGVPWRLAIKMMDDGWILRDDIIWDKMKGTQSAKDRFRDLYEHVFHFVKSQKYFFDSKKILVKPRKLPKVSESKTISATGVSGKKYYKQIEQSSVLSELEKANAKAALDETIEEIRLGLVNDFRMTIRGVQRAYQGNNIKKSGRARELEEKGFYILKMKSSGFLPSNIWSIVPEDKVRKDAHCAVFPEELIEIPILSTCPECGIILDPFSGTGTTVLASIKHNRKAIGIDISDKYTAFAEKRISKFYKNK